MKGELVFLLLLLHYANAQFTCIDNSLRLVGGNAPNEGTVEICVNGAWGTVCDDDWGDPDASVVCAQLGFMRRDAESFIRAHFGQGTGDIELDEVNCNGNEARLIDCPHRTIDNCNHFEDAGVRCVLPPCDNGDVRLAGNTNRVGEGRVEVCINQQWGTVCDDLWDGLDASVVCRQLGYSSRNAQGYRLARFGQGTSLPILMDNVQCTGTENSLISCSYDPLTSDCSHFEDASVRCQIELACRNGEVRLSGGRRTNEGRVEVCVNETWGTVCNDLWSSIDAGVVCAQLGYPRLGAISTLSFGAGTGPILFDDLACVGTESSLLECPYDSDARDCSHIEDAGVRCSNSSVCDAGSVRLVQPQDGSPAVAFAHNSTIRGRVEVCIDNEWGTVCDDLWGVADSAVVCGQLGYSRFNSTAISRIGGGTVPIKLDDVGCSGTESRLVDCTYRGRHNCIHQEDAGVTCNTTLICNNGDTRLVNGPTEMEGRVELCWREAWGTVCDRDWGLNDGKVVCRQLGFSSLSVTTFGSAAYGQGSGPILLSMLQCSGSEANLTNCTHNGIGRADLCTHSDDAGVRCRAVACEDGELRVAAGRSSYEGRVEVCWSERWGTVCDDQWDDMNAAVVCRQLGLTIPAGLSAVSFRGYAEGFGAGTGAILLDNVQCSGSEQRLVQCSHAGIGNNDCLHAEDAGVRCPQCVEGSVRLVGGSTIFEGRVEVCAGGEWGTVCDDGWGSEEALVVCRQLGFTSQNAVALVRAAFGQGNGTIAMDDVRCVSSDQTLLDCNHIDASQHIFCSHSEDAGVRCQSPLTGAPRSVISIALSDTTVTLSWSPPLSSEIFQPIDRYTITCSATGYPQETVNTNSGSTINVVVIGLHADVTYDCCVSVVTTSGQGTPACSSVQTHEAAPSGPPQSLSGHAVTATSLTLSWSPPTSNQQNGVIREYRIAITELDSGRILSYISTSTSLGVTALHPYYTYRSTVAAVTVSAGPATQPHSITTFQAAPSGPPLSLRSTSTRNVSFTVTWEPPLQENRNGIITGYRLSVTKASTGATLAYSATTNELNVGPLQPNTLYTCVVVASTVNGTGPASVRIEVRTMEGTPSIPRQVGATTFNSSSLRLFWSPPQVQNGIIRGYRVRLVEVETGTIFQLTTHTTSITVPALHPNYYYQYSVAAYTIINGAYSIPREVRMPEHVPSAAPRNLASTAVTETSIRLAWDPPALQDRNGVITHYTVSYYSHTDLVTNTVETTDTFRVISSLQPATTYLIAVSASTAVGPGPMSSHIIVATVTGVPTGFPRNVQLSALDSRTLLITWSPPPLNQQGGAITGYNISLTERETGQQFAFITGAQSHGVFSLHPFYNYDCQVLAFTAMGPGPLSPVTSLQMPQDVPSGYPQAFSVAVRNATLISLLWAPPLASESNGIITGYSIRGTVEMGETVQFTTTATSLEFTAQPYKSYEFVVAAKTTVGRGPFSPEESVQTPEIAPTHVPTNLTKEDISATSFRLSWAPPPVEHHNGVITEYRVNVTVTNTEEQFQLSTGDTEITISNLHPYYLYMCTVTAVTVAEGPYTASIAVRTAEAAPSATPLSFQVIVLNATSILLEWNAPPADARNGIVRKYRVVISNLATGDEIQEFAFAEHLTVHALLPYNTYRCKVAAYTTAIGPFTAVMQATTSAEIPSGPPQAVVVTSVGSRGLMISWSPPRPEQQNGEIIRYTVRTTEVNTGRVYSNDTSSASLSLSGLHPFYAYACSVAAWTAIGRGPFSSDVSQQLPEDAPSSAPLNVRAMLISSTSTRISWSAPPVEDHNGIIRQYQIVLTEVNTTTGRQWDLVSNTNALLLDFLSPHFTYQLRVAALTVSRGPFSALYTFTALQDIPGSPTNLTATKVDPRTIRLDWEPPPEDQRNGVITHYTVTVAPLSSPSPPPSEYSSVGTSYTVESLLPSQSYLFTVYAETNIGRGPGIAVYAQLSEDIPSGAPRNLESTAFDSMTLQLRWKQPLETNGMVRDYKITIFEVDTGNVSFTYETVSNSLLVTDLHPFYTYVCSVAANTVGVGPSANVTIKMPEDVPSAAPLNLRLTDVLSPNSVALTWDPPPVQHQNGNITLYVVSVASDQENRESFHETTELRNHQIMILEAFSTYEVSVAAQNSAGRGPFTPALQVNTPQDVPSSAPVVGETLRISATEVQISWSPLSEEDSRGIVTGYFVKYRPIVGEFRRNLDDISTVLNTTETNLTIGDLEPTFRYGIAVAAGTTAGLGNYSTEAVIEVYENSLFQLHLSGAIVCEPWLSDGAADKVEDIINLVAMELRGACNCQVSGKFIGRASLFCGDHSTDRVILQAAVVGAEDTSSETILQHMQEWVYAEPSLISRGVQLSVLPCSVHVTEYGNTTTTCIDTAATITTPPTTAPATTEVLVVEPTKKDGSPVIGIYAGAGGGFVLLILFVVVLIVLLVGLRRRQKKRMQSLQRPDLRLNITLDDNHLPGGQAGALKEYDNIPEFPKEAEANAEDSFTYSQEHIYDDPVTLTTFATQHQSARKFDLPPPPAYNTVIRDPAFARGKAATAAAANAPASSGYAKLDVDAVPTTKYRNVGENASTIRIDYEDITSPQTFKSSQAERTTWKDESSKPSKGASDETEESPDHDRRRYTPLFVSKDKVQPNEYANPQILMKSRVEDDHSAAGGGDGSGYDIPRTGAVSATNALAIRANALATRANADQQQQQQQQQLTKSVDEDYVEMSSSPSSMKNE